MPDVRNLPLPVTLDKEFAEDSAPFVAPSLPDNRRQRQAHAGFPDTAGKIFDSLDNLVVLHPAQVEDDFVDALEILGLEEIQGKRTVDLENP